MSTQEKQNLSWKRRSEGPARCEVKEPAGAGQRSDEARASKTQPLNIERTQAKQNPNTVSLKAFFNLDTLKV